MDLLTCSTRQNAPVEDLDIIIIGLLIIFTNYDHNETSEPKKKQSQIHQRQMDEDRTWSIHEGLGKIRQRLGQRAEDSQNQVAYSG